MASSRIQTVLALLVAAVGLVIMVVLGVFAYASLTARPVHPEPDKVPAHRTTASAEWADAIEQARQIAHSGLIEQNLPGLSVAVGIGGEIVWTEGLGWADLESRTPVTPDTAFRIGTASMPLTSAAIGLLLEKNRLNLDERIQMYVPEFPETQWPVTLRQLMGHVAGVRSDGGDEGPFRSEHCERTMEGLRIFADRSLLFEPGTDFRLSKYGWILLSAAVESAAKQPFLEFMRQQVFNPLQMDDTMAESPADAASNRAAFYFPNFAGDPRYGNDGARQVDYSCYAGASTFLSSPSDLVRFGMAVNAGKLLQPSTVQVLQTPLRLASGQETGYALGWDLENVQIAGQPTVVVGHDGEVMGGMVASLITIPSQGAVVAVTSNIAFADTFSLATKVAEAFAGRRGRSAPAR